MHIDTQAILCASRPHGEHGAIVKLMTEGDGLQSGYVRGGRGRRLKPTLFCGNIVQARLRSRTDGQLPHAEVELVHSRAPLMGEPLAAGAIEWATVITATILPEGQPYPRLYAALGGLLTAVESAPAASGWGAALVQYELLLLSELGFGLDLESCAVTGRTDDLTAVSPRSGRAVSAAEAKAYADKLLPLPAFVLRGGVASWAEILDGLALTGHFLTRDLLTGRSERLDDTRARLISRLRRAAGRD